MKRQSQLEELSEPMEAAPFSAPIQGVEDLCRRSPGALLRNAFGVERIAPQLWN